VPIVTINPSFELRANAATAGPISPTSPTTKGLNSTPKDDATPWIVRIVLFHRQIEIVLMETAQRLPRSATGTLHRDIRATHDNKERPQGGFRWGPWADQRLAGEIGLCADYAGTSLYRR
jgi:hypothetical protein